jgi:hypothetical protein
MDGLLFGKTFLYNNIKFIKHFFVSRQRANHNKFILQQLTACGGGPNDKV